MTSQEPTLKAAIGEHAQDFSSDFATLRNDLARLTDTVSTLVRNQADNAGATVRTAIGQARETLHSTANQASDRVASLGNEFESLIERNPLTAVLIALGVGVVAGMLTTGRK